MSRHDGAASARARGTVLVVAVGVPLKCPSMTRTSDERPKPALPLLPPGPRGGTPLPLAPATMLPSDAAPFAAPHGLRRTPHALAGCAAGVLSFGAGRVLSWAAVAPATTPPMMPTEPTPDTELLLVPAWPGRPWSPVDGAAPVGSMLRPVVLAGLTVTAPWSLLVAAPLESSISSSSSGPRGGAASDPSPPTGVRRRGPRRILTRSASPEAPAAAVAAAVLGEAPR